MHVFFLFFLRLGVQKFIEYQMTDLEISQLSLLPVIGKMIRMTYITNQLGYNAISYGDKLQKNV